MEGFLERLNAFVDRQHFCEKDEDVSYNKRKTKGRHNILHTWLRLSAMKVLLGARNVSCSDTCYSNGESQFRIRIHSFTSSGNIYNIQ